jgi:hypothetical protein
LKFLEHMLEGYSLESLLLYFVAVVAILRATKQGDPGSSIVGTLISLFRRDPSSFKKRNRIS